MIAMDLTGAATVRQSQTGMMPKELAYGRKPGAVSAAFQRISCRPVNGNTFSPSQDIQIQIPCQPRTYLDTANSYLKFTVTSTTDAITPSIGASSFIERIEITHQSNQLERIQRYGDVYAWYLQMQSGSDRINNNVGPLEGVSSKKQYYLTGVPANLAGEDPSEIAQPNTVLCQGDTIAGGGGSRDYIHQIMSGVLGPQMNSYLPLSAMNQAGDILLQISLASVVKACQVAAGLVGNFTVTNVAFVAHVITLDEVGDRRVLDAFSGGQLALNTESWWTHQDSIPANSSSANILIGARYASLKTMFTFLQSDVDVISSSTRSTGGFIKARLSQYQYRLGGVLFPNQPISTPYESYAELLKAFHGMVHPETAIGVPFNNYNSDTVIVDTRTRTLRAHAAAAVAIDPQTTAGGNVTVAATALSTVIGYACFGIGVSLEAFSSRTGLILNGLDTRSSTVHAELTLTAGGNAFVTDVLNICQYDKLLVVDQQSGAMMKIE